MKLRETSEMVPGTEFEGLCTEFKICPSCGRIYWRGTHYSQMNDSIRRIQASKGEPDSHEKGIHDHPLLRSV